MRLTLSEVVRIAHDMASVAQQLHANGIMHGDFYAHNILVGSAGHALLGDFGAACFVSKEAMTHHASALEQIEVRAFGCLLEELLERSDAANDHSESVRQALEDLRDRCLTEEVTQRPQFTELVQALLRIQAEG
jgi:predicted unusual protein kinase regulating ubiquinone biosynthesis (AarF/ABC1/UbiB family)